MNRNRSVTRLLFLLCLATIVQLLGTDRMVAAAAEQWGIFELALTGPSSGNPYLEVQWSATFSQGSRTIKVPGFWNGGSSYKLRFSPPAAGEWIYKTSSAVPELDGKSGSLQAGKPAGNNHGPVQIYDTYYFRYADGTSYHQFGTTCYQWTSMPEELQQTTLKTLSTAPFNKIRMCVFPKWYAHNKVEPDSAAFLKGANGKYDFSRPDPAYWERFEQRLLDLQKLGIEADIILWHPYDNWGFKRMGAEADDRYLRYCIARLSAYRNVWWSLANEWDFTGKSESDFNRFGAILQQEDPHQRLRSIHNGSKIFDQTQPWITHVSRQGYDTKNGISWRDKYKKPVIFDEMGYEGNIPEGYGRNAPTLTTQRFYWGTFSGVYCGHSECYQDPNEVLWWGKGGVLKGESPARIKYLEQEVMAKAPSFAQLKPMGNLLLAKDGEYYMIYCDSKASKTIQLGGAHSYKVECIDTWAMTVTAVGTAKPGAYTIAPPKADVVYRFIPES